MQRIIFTSLLVIFSISLFATVGKKQLQIKLQAQFRSTDQTTIYFDLGVTPAYNAAEDVPKFMSSFPGVPNIYSVSSDNIKCANNGYSSLSQSAIIGLGTLIDSPALYTFSLQQFSDFDSTTIVFLEDRKLNRFTELQTDFYQVELSREDTTGRFFLHVTSAVQFNPVTAGCNNNNGAISITSDSSITWNTVSLMDSSGAALNVYNNANSAFVFDMLPEGNYKVSFNYNGYSTTKQIFVNGNHITVAITASSQNVVVGENINFLSAAINTTDYVWTYGDSTVETGVANPTYFYYQPGTYTVTLTCSNHAGCMADAELLINVGEATGITNQTAKAPSIINLGSKTIEVLMNNLPIDNTELWIYNVLGQSIYTSRVTADEMQVSLPDQPAGVYLITLKARGKSTTTKVYIN